MTSLPKSYLYKSAEELEEMGEEGRYNMLLAARAAQAREFPFGAAGFADFYWCGTHHELPPYARDVWVPELVDAKLHSTGVLLEGFRGATKSTVIFWWVLYVLGKRPVGSTVLCRINDAAAAETGNAMAEVIEKSIAWKMCFPTVVPDPERRWSTEGWFIKDTSENYNSWVQRTISDHLGEPSLLTAGITSGVHIGKHPSNGWYFDDFHDEQNTRSLREMRNIVDTIEKNIIPTWTRPEGHPTLAGACTFWDEQDGYHSLLKTGLFKHVRTPIFVPDPTSDVIYDGLAHHGEKVRLAWPEDFGIEKIRQIEMQNPVWFPVMYLCDLGAMKGTVLKKDWLQEYPAEMIKDEWPTYFGVDFASSADKVGERDRDYFAMAVGKAIPGGGIVLVDGLRGKFPAAESMGRIKAFHAKYQRLVAVGVEKWGKGETFKDMLIYNTKLPVIPCPYEGTATKSKGQRFESEGGLAPMFIDGRLWISSDCPEDFRKAFTDEWISWDGQQTKTGHDDCLDAVYWMAYVGQGHLTPTADRNRERRPKSKSPYATLAHQY